MSPAKGEEIQPSEPEKKRARQQLKVRVADHDHYKLAIPFFDNFGPGSSYPEYKIPDEDNNSPEKGSTGADQLQVYEELKQPDESEEDSLKTDSSMRDYPYHLEEHQVFYKLEKPAYSMLKPSEGPEKTEDMGAGLLSPSPKLEYDKNEDEEAPDKDDGDEKFMDHILDDKGPGTFDDIHGAKNMASGDAQKLRKYN